MQFDDSSVDVSGVDDRRGMGGGALAMGGGGLGVVGLILYLVINVLGSGGGTGSGLAVPRDTALEGGQAGETQQDLRARCNSDGALDRYTDCRLIKVYNVADAVWRDEFARRNLPYQRPALAFFTRAATTGCGQASAAVGPFYCPADREIYFELGFLEQLQRQFGAPGEFAQAYIVAHEYGHHLQTLLGTERRVRAAQQRYPAARNGLSVAMELQADCYAGVWSRLADERGEDGIALSEQDILEAVQAAEAVGDDRIQQRTQGRVSPESWTHGSAEQRRTWFVRGLQTGDLEACDTFRGTVTPTE
jgi:predicted metalloprotease